MVTGYDHILFLLGVVFFLYRMKDVAIYVSLFAIGHSTTMLAGVYFGWDVNAYIIDAIIGLSVVYKALDNMGAYQRWFGFQPNTKAATLLFGFCDGLGLATKIFDTRFRQTGFFRTCLRSTLASRSVSFWPLPRSSSSWGIGGERRRFGSKLTPQTSS